MKKSFGKKTTLLPLPVYTIGTYDEDGKANAMNLAWGTQCGYHEVSLSIAKEHKTDYFGIESGNKVDKIEKSGVHVVKSENIDAPIIKEFPLTLECKVIEIQEELGDYRVVAEIINTLADESVLNEKGQIDVDKLELITFDSITNSYRVLGEKVGQAFKDGRFENCGLLLAFFFPYFFLSTILESLVKNPASLKAAFKLSSASTKALATPCLIAPACPELPPPTTFTLTAYLSKVSVNAKGCSTILERIALPPKYSSIPLPFISTPCPPGINLTLATEVFLLPVPKN